MLSGGPWVEIDLIPEIFGFTVINRHPEDAGKIGPLPPPKEARIRVFIRFLSLWARTWGHQGRENLATESDITRPLNSPLGEFICYFGGSVD